MRKFTLIAALAAGLFIFLSYLGNNSLSAFFHPPSLYLVVLYTAVLVLARYSPGQCVYRMLVLKARERHSPTEVRKAGAFASYVGARLLVGGLILTLAKAAWVMCAGTDMLEIAGALSTSLTSALYAMLLYLPVARQAVI